MLNLTVLPAPYSVCRIACTSTIDWSGELTFVGKTPDELSLVCETQLVPESASEREDDWRALRVDGVLDFSLVGILSGITSVLAAQSISVFCVSTYNTDYLLVKENALDSAVFALRESGYCVR